MEECFAVEKLGQYVHCARKRVLVTVWMAFFCNKLILLMLACEVRLMINPYSHCVGNIGPTLFKGILLKTILSVKNLEK
jgi:hypothetical protein